MGDDIIINITQPSTQPVNISLTEDEDSYNVTPIQNVISIGTSITDTTENVNINVVDTVDNINVNTPYPIGATGASGIQGATGVAGPQGATGASGIQGFIGATGASGIQGIVGATGTSITILGSLALTPGNEQADLNNAFPGAIPGNSVIDTNTGNLWVYDGTQWKNVGKIEGPQGATGASGIQGFVGATGASGIQGFIGATGASGIQGTTGATGASGIQGFIGATGASGIQGATGASGIQGFIGATGAPGIQGVIGATGASGIQGFIGATGTSGIQGFVGATGASGIQGLIGATGASGVQGFVGATGASGIQGTTGASGVQGLIGATGASGIQGFIGATGASGIQGNIGATGLRGATGASGIQGFVGATGTSGIQGNIGATGASGIQGFIGATGASGVQGVIGATGASGIQGFVGATGASGIQGFVGATGASGIQGFIGATGASGIQGATGLTGSTGLRGSTGPDFVFPNDLTVSLPSPKTFGRYSSGEVIPATGKTPAQVIEMAIVQPINPIVNLTPNPTTIPFNQTAINNTLNFSYTIQSLNASVSAGVIEFKRANQSIWTTLSTGVTSNPGSFIHTFTDTAFNTNTLNYRYTVADVVGGITTQTANITIQSYSAPSGTLTLSGNTLTPETNVLREKGNVATIVNGSVTRNSVNVPLSAYRIQINIDNIGWTTIFTNTAVGPASFSIPNFFNNPVASNTANSIAYRVLVDDSFQASTIIFNSTNNTINFRNLIFYGPVSAPPTNSAGVRNITNRGFAPVGGTGNLANPFILNTGSTLLNFTVAMPTPLTITEVLDLDVSNANITSQYINNPFNIVDSGGVSTSYNVYTMTIAGAYSFSHRHQITRA
jgi:hypothetical protein